MQASYDHKATEFWPTCLAMNPELLCRNKRRFRYLIGRTSRTCVRGIVASSGLIGLDRGYNSSSMFRKGGKAHLKDVMWCATYFTFHVRGQIVQSGERLSCLDVCLPAQLAVQGGSIGPPARSRYHFNRFGTKPSALYLLSEQGCIYPNQHYHGNNNSTVFY